MYNEQVRHFVVENFLFGEDNLFADDQSLMQQGIVDSTGILELVMYLEETFAIRIADDELVPANLDSVNNISAFLSRKLAPLPQVGSGDSLWR